MKKLLPILLLLFVGAILFSACNSKSSADANEGKVLTYTDTVGLADFQKWKVQNELKDPSVYYQVGSVAAARESTKKPTKTYSSVQRTSNISGRSSNSVSQYPAKTTVKKGWS